MAHHIEIRSKQGMLDEAATYYRQLEAVESATALSDDVRFEVQHARALYARARGDLPAAEQLWRKLLDLSYVLGGQKYVVNRRWLATCLYQQGRLPEAQQLFHESLQDAIQIADQRSVIGNMLKLVAIDLDQGTIAGVAAQLAECRSFAERLQDRRRLAEIHRLSARLHSLRGDYPAAGAELALAIDLFERLGMRRELNEARGAVQLLAE
jgi:tetratricopeptide (TPR) repeat protein